MRNSGAHYILQRCFKDDDTNKIFIDIEKSVWIHPWIQFTWVVWLLKSTNNYPENTQRHKESLSFWTITNHQYLQNTPFKWFDF